MKKILIATLSLGVLAGCQKQMTVSAPVSPSNQPVSAQFSDRQYRQSVLRTVAEGFVMLDKNGDGKITLGEIPDDEFGFSKKFFQEVDLDKSGFVTLTEAKSFYQKGMTKENIQSQRLWMYGYHTKMDVNKDKKLSRSEFMTADLKIGPSWLGRPEMPSKEQLWQDFDRNHNGSLTKDEFSDLLLDLNENGYSYSLPPH